VSCAGADGAADVCRANEIEAQGAAALAAGLKSVSGLQKLDLG
jgi:hypothetical protein